MGMFYGKRFRKSVEFVQFCAVFRYLFNNSGLIVRIFNFYMRIYDIFGKF